MCFIRKTRIPKKYFVALTCLAVIYSYLTFGNPFAASHAVRFTQTKYDLTNLNATRIEEFDTILRTECPVESNEYPLKCLHSLKNYDQKHGILRLKTDAEKCNDCLYYHKDNALTMNKLVIYHHTFWQLNKINTSVDSFNMRVLKLNIMSYLTTQNSCCTRFIFWKLPEFPAEFLGEIELTFAHYIASKQVQIRTFDLVELCSSEFSSFQASKLCSWYKYADLSQNGLVSLSDLVRFVVLELYGGVYTDGDVIYLKDMRSLWPFNFAYRWSFTQNLNTAVLGINFRVDPTIERVYDQALGAYWFGLRGFYYLFHPYTISSIVRTLNDQHLFNYRTLRALNCVLFDPAWLCADSGGSKGSALDVCAFDEFNKKYFVNESDFRPAEFYAGAFAYHLHLKDLGFQVADYSYFKYFENYFYRNLLLIKS